ncbi:uncharacterized protein LOC143050874 [Mytilus galloprovincialis]|uniref:uncharacterized protein LOC143050874 n=1 Tax=Mytilus galloprovincialis TaxID=29158 RepID=UPI003F7B4EDA
MDKMHCWYLLMCIYIILNMKVEGGQICMKCSHAAHPDCGEVERCQDYEKCYVREYLTHSGRAWFESGCADQQKCKSDPGITSSGFGRRQTESLTVCEKCCNDTAICNAKGLCGDITFQTPGPICFQCADASKSNDCDLITTCFKHEKCFLQKKQNSFSHRYHWSSGCASEVVCQFLQQFQTDDRLCNYCCDGDLCNSECKYHSVVLTTTDYNNSSLKTSTQEPASLQITIETTTTVNELLPCENRISNGMFLVF